MKVYVKETRYRNADGDRLIKVKTYKNKPKHYTYVVWV